MISIITASYNYEQYITETIQSVLNQTYTDWEMIIVDDCSTDNSIEVINSFKDDRIKLFKNEKNLGLKETLLHGLQKASGEWIVFLESDDLISPDYLEKKLGIAQNFPEVSIIFNDVKQFGNEEIIKKVEAPFIKNNLYLSKKKYPCNIFKEFNVQNRILTFSCFMCKKEILKEEYFNTPIDKLLDWWLYIHLTHKNYVYYIPEKLTQWRMHSNSYIGTKQGPKFHLIQLKAYYDVLKKFSEINILFFLKSIILILAAHIIKKSSHNSIWHKP